MPLLHALDQAKTIFASVQFGQQPNRLVVSAHEVGLYLVERVVDVDAPQFVIPAVFGRQPHAVEHQAVKQLRFGGERLEPLAAHQQSRNPEVAELLGFFSVKVGEIDLRFQGNHLALNCIYLLFNDTETK